MENKKFRSILYEDEQLLIVNKSSGLLTVPAHDAKGNDLSSLLNELKSEQNNSPKIYPCHRLDKETSGVLIFAKGKTIQQQIMDQFREKKVKKIYIAFVHGRVKKTEGTLKSSIQGAWPYRRHEKKKVAITNFKLLSREKGFSIMQLQPVTGRTNQIRLQFKEIGHPLVGERRFVFARDWPIKFKRVALHALSIEFQHPVNKKRISFSAYLPKDMDNFLITHGVEDFRGKILL